MPREHLLALLRRQRGEQRLEQLAHDAVGELLLEVGAARDQHLEAGLRREAARLRDRRVLPIPARPSIATTRPAPEVRGVHHAPAARQLRPRVRAAACSRPGRPCGAAGSAAGPSRARASRAAGSCGPGPGPRAGRAARAGRSPAAPSRPRSSSPSRSGRSCRTRFAVVRREQHLPAVTRVADAGGLVDGEADVAVACRRSPRRCAAPCARGPRPPSGHSCSASARWAAAEASDRRARAAEDDEERVALGVDLDPAGLREGRAQKPVVRGEHVAVAVAAEVLEQAGRALDVREQEGHGPRGQGSGSLADCWCAQF